MDELLASSSRTGMASSTGSARNLTFTPHNDVVAFGLPTDLSDLHLPNNRDILKYYFFLSERSKIENPKCLYKTFTPHVADKLTSIWSKLNIEIIKRNDIVKKLNGLLNKYRKETTNRGTIYSSFSNFVDSTKNLFYIGKCKCELKTRECSCGLIPPHLKKFMMDQNNDRKLTIPEFTEEIVEVAPIPTFSIDSDDQSDTEMDEVQNENTAPVPLASVQKTQEHYTQRYDTFNFAMMCDKFGITDKEASCLATAFFKDINLRDVRGNPVVMDESKVAKEKIKCRDAVLRRQHTDSCITAFSFDVRKNDSLTKEKIDEKFHTKMVKEPHLVVLKEPRSELLGYINLGAEKDAKTKHKKLNEFFINKALSIDELFGICCDGEPANTGTENGVLRLFEKQLNRPLHWFICLLHFNDLLFRHLCTALEKTDTSGSRTSTRKIFKDIQDCEKLQVFTIILLFTFQ